MDYTNIWFNGKDGRVWCNKCEEFSRVKDGMTYTDITTKCALGNPEIRYDIYKPKDTDKGVVAFWILKNECPKNKEE